MIHLQPKMFIVRVTRIKCIESTFIIKYAYENRYHYPENVYAGDPRTSKSEILKTWPAKG